MSYTSTQNVFRMLCNTRTMESAPQSTEASRSRIVFEINRSGWTDGAPAEGRSYKEDEATLASITLLPKPICYQYCLNDWLLVSRSYPRASVLFSVPKRDTSM